MLVFPVSLSSLLLMLAISRFVGHKISSLPLIRDLKFDLLTILSSKDPIHFRTKNYEKSIGQKILLILKGGSESPLYGSEDGVNQRLAEPEVAAGHQFDQLLFGHNKNEDQAAQEALLLHMDVVLCIGIRNPTCTAIEDDEFSDYLDNILSSPHETIIMGDLNLPHINGATCQSQAPGSKLIDLINTNSLQHVNEPTRRNNILHFVMTTPDLSINGLEVTGKVGDQQMIV
ncbi:Endonuclease/exonuclease/phosphatase [Trinorchestia longiramus]|nr:Endonuclease/exonuclease/phosphatase [Trinorchestia longiramus]